MSDIVRLTILFSALLLLLGTIILIVGMFTNKNSKKNDYILEWAQGISDVMMVAAGIIFFVGLNQGGIEHSEILILPTLSLLLGTIILIVGMTTNKNSFSNLVMKSACSFAITMFIVAACVLVMFYIKYN